MCVIAFTTLLLGLVALAVVWSDDPGPGPTPPPDIKPTRYL